MLWGFRHNRWRRWPRGLPRRREATVWWNVFVRGLQIPIRGLLRGRQVPVRGHQIFVRRRKVLVRGLEIPIQGVKILVLGRQVLVQDRLACRGPEEMLQSAECPGLDTCEAIVWLTCHAGIAFTFALLTCGHRSNGKPTIHSLRASRVQ
jgi:hypothetical protein